MKIGFCYLNGIALKAPVHLAFHITGKVGAAYHVGQDIDQKNDADDNEAYPHYGAPAKYPIAVH